MMTVRKSRYATAIAKTIRFPADVLEFVESFSGDNFSERLMNLILSFKQEIPERMERLERLDTQIKERLEKLDRIDERIAALDDVLCNVLYIQPTFQAIRADVLAIMESLPQKEEKEKKQLGCAHENRDG